MPQALDITCEVSDKGAIPRKYSEWVRDHLQLYAGGEVRIRVSRPKRTTRANRYWWGYVLETIRQAMIEAGIGFMETNEGIKAVSSEALHHHFKTKYLPVRTAVVFGEDITLPPTTTTLDQTQFSEFVEAVKTDPQVRQLGIHFEEPEPLRSYAIADLPV